MRIQPGMTNQTMMALALCSGASLALAVVLGGCSESANNSTAQQGGTGNDGTSGATSSTAGGATSTASGGTALTGPGVWVTVNVELIPEVGVAAKHTNLGGFAKDTAPLPDLFTVSQTSGACKLLVPTYVLCDAPKCTSVESCIADNKCARNPVPVGMGNLTFTGLLMEAGGSDYVLNPLSATTPSYSGVGVAYPPCTLGTDVSVAGGADAATAFSVKTACIEPLVLGGADPLPFEQNKATQLTWTPPTAAGKSSISVRIDISHHGGLKGLIVCDTPDNGSLEVAAGLVTGLIGLGTFGFPEARVTRLSSASVAAGSGSATLNVQSIVARPLAIPGVTSCTADADCTITGQVCSDGLKCVVGP